ncbi:MAG: hypothetical protein AUK47_01225 [Deltaproteobacteria bacterium CG2_30_63_29]|nr:MAG: hypothetical protein AUK47_01225 [Deltaproteobacteria bacterium CG2_30_63_29]
MLLVMVLLASSVTACDDAPNQPPSDASLLIIKLERWRAYLDVGETSNLMSTIAPSFLNQGHDYEAFSRWIADLMALGDLKVDLRNITLNIDGDQAQVDYTLEISVCKPVLGAPDGVLCALHLRCHSNASSLCGWARYWRLYEDGWRLVGDGQEWGDNLTLQFAADGIEVVGNLFDPKGVLSSVDLGWGNTLRSELVRSAGTWELTETLEVPNTLYPDHPFPWILDLTWMEAGQRRSSRVEFVQLMDQFASDFSPVGEALLPIEFAWSSRPVPEGGVEVRLLDGDTTLWRSKRVFDERLSYAGPELSPGSIYRAQVVTFDLFGNSAVSESTLVPQDPTMVSPHPTSVSPTNGPATGGTAIVILGDHFLEGLRVDIGAVPCVGVLRVDQTQLQCTTPALAPATYHIAVINPSGAVGLLEDAFTAL